MKAFLFLIAVLAFLSRLEAARFEAFGDFLDY